jgi:hypothetical protein
MNIHPLRLLSTTLTASVFLATAGCISTHQTVTIDVPRTKVAFANEKAGRLFYETLARATDPRPHEEKRTQVNLILLNIEERTVVGPNRLFNEAVSFCDTNHDGEITETEADIFSSAWPPAKV